MALEKKKDMFLFLSPDAIKIIKVNQQRIRESLYCVIVLSQLWNFTGMSETEDLCSITPGMPSFYLL